MTDSVKANFFGNCEVLWLVVSMRSNMMRGIHDEAMRAFRGLSETLIVC